MKRELEPDILLGAYCQGIFPMAMDERGKLGWFSPDPRAIIPIDHRFHVPHGLRRTLRKQPYRVTADQDFEGVIDGCATEHGKTWISRDIRSAYLRLHREGFAHSIEAWRDEQLVGGLYGVHVGGAFFGESMFHRATDASKICLVTLVERLRTGGFLLLDTQWTTPHLLQFGTMEIPRADYLKLLNEAIARDAAF